MSNETETSPDLTARTCAWSGEESTGKHYELKSTEGTELVSEDSLRGGADTTELRAQLRALTKRVAALESARADKGTAGAPRAPRTRKVPAARTTGE